jgi:hypothetical protein
VATRPQELAFLLADLSTAMLQNAGCELSRLRPLAS